MQGLTGRGAHRPVDTTTSQSQRTQGEAGFPGHFVLFFLVCFACNPAVSSASFPMPHRKLVQIGKAAPLPTVAKYFADLSARQGEDIRLLKERALAHEQEQAHKKSVREESWRLHPVVATRRRKKAAGKKRASTKRSATTAKAKRARGRTRAARNKKI